MQLLQQLELCSAPVQDRQAVTWCDLQARCLLFESTIHFNASAAHLSFKSRSKKMDSRIAFVSALRASALQQKPCSGWNRPINPPTDCLEKPLGAHDQVASAW